VVQSAVSEDRRDPRPDVLRMRGREGEETLKRRRAEQRDDDELEEEGDPHHPEYGVHGVAPEVPQYASRRAFAVDPTPDAVDEPRVRRLDLAGHGVVEAALEHAGGVVPLVKARTVVTLRQSVGRTERLPASVALIREILVLPTLVTRRHCDAVRLDDVKRFGSRPPDSHARWRPRPDRRTASGRPAYRSD